MDYSKQTNHFTTDRLTAKQKKQVIRQTSKDVTYLVFSMLVCMGLIKASIPTITHVYASGIASFRGITTPYSFASTQNFSPVPTNTPTPTPLPTQYQLIHKEIEDVFGADAPIAFKLLSCENSALDPNITNVNEGGSVDFGIFQINEYWQKIQGKFLLNWKINIQVAHQLFMENGKQFNLWTCGRKLGV